MSCPILQELFLKWCNLSDKEKVLLNYLTYYILDKSQTEIYTSIVQGLTYWNAVQDFEGACGFSENPLDFKFDMEEEKLIFRVVMITDDIASNILLRPNLCAEIKEVVNETKKHKLIAELHRLTGEGDK
ncbi:unnamed protein product [Callosobruchus maculatus]|uniref:Uncharacterized protein n=1 Tax=Callosobruchus maculatus TaxID=64391 RepID=A0A653DBL0_CALMS|nr:unnamed protein product [Callosobruchus maculatus]